MKKIVFVTLMMADDMHKRHYPVDGNSFIVINYDNNNYAYKASSDTLAYIRPVINVYKSKLK